MAWRIGTYRLSGKIEQTSIGVRIPAYIARTGILSYIQPDGSTIREYRPADEVFAADSLGSWAGVPVTDGHPPDMLDGVSYKRWQCGHTGDDVSKADDDTHVSASIRVIDDDLIAAIERKERADLSGGYWVDIDDTPGEIDGQPYDRVQRNIRGNHVAILPPGLGRSGRDVSIRLDSKGNAYIDVDVQRSTKMALRIDGQTYEDLSAAQAAIEAVQDRERDLQSAIAELEGKISSHKTRNDELESDAKDLQLRLDEATDQTRLDTAIAERIALLDKARRIRSDGSYDGKNSREIMVEALGATDDYPSDDFVRGAFLARADLTSSASRSDADKVRATLSAKPESNMDRLQREYISRSKNAWRGSQQDRGQS